MCTDSQQHFFPRRPDLVVVVGAAGYVFHRDRQPGRRDEFKDPTGPSRHCLSSGYRGINEFSREHPVRTAQQAFIRVPRSPTGDQ